MRIPTRTLVTACALSAALLVAGCGGAGDQDEAAAGSGGEVFLQPAAAQGPDPFTGSSAGSTASPPPVTRTPQPAPSGSDPSTGTRSLSGGTPGLYGGTESVGSCDVEKQLGFLTADRVKARAFAEASGISQASVPGYLRGMTSVVLRADTRVTNHGFRDGRATGYQSVLQAGTAVLVDNRGVPRVRCACGNPLTAPGAVRGTSGDHGRPWPGYRSAQVIVVTPAPRVITNITIVNIVGNTWIERRIGDDGHHDHVVPPPDGHTRPPRPDESPSGRSPHEKSPSPEESASDCVTPTATVTVTPGATDGTTTPPGDPASPDERTSSPEESASAESASRGSPPAKPSDCPTATVTAPPTASTGPATPSSPSDRSAAPDTTVPGTDEPSDAPTATESAAPADSSGEETGPDTAPERRDGGGRIPDHAATADSIFGNPTDVFDS
ncbi:DUF6777 domain-containing protein [Streptomyces sp. NPDC058371]|uniref:DUF6777 domain-containing protein n=1 Tax=Streptomyces sp. NPDC058371 TaxID=3346463 RepID=UPI003664D359